ncbi:MAG: carbon-nitrogen family hydrolase [Verrucomicrobia bacterium]|nr:MAG: carbon-nitrogen family hydrolase [Verrucomicrobiota bacterium]
MRVNVIALQPDIAWENKAANFAKARQLLQRAAPEKNSLVALPEMFATGFSMNSDAIAEPGGGETEQFLSSLAKEFGVTLVAGAAMRGRDGKARNKALVFSPAGELICFYAKMRPFTPGAEDQHYTAGTKTTVFAWNDCTVSPFICYDLRFPELFRDAAARHRPALFVVVANFPEKRLTHWLRLLQARAIENQAYVLGANRVGSDPFYTYGGRSVVIDPQGEIIADAGAAEGFVKAQLDLANLRKYREGLPFLDDLKFSAA